MKKTSNLMYNIGRIFTIIELILGPILIALGTLFLILSAVIEDFSVAADSASLIVYGVWFLIGGILCLIFVGRAKKELENEGGKRNFKPYIITIVFGVVGSNPFYIVAGILGIIVESKQGDNNEPKQVEEPKEEPAEEPKAE